MDTFESLENLNVSEECFNDIISIVEESIMDLIKRGMSPEEAKDEYFNQKNKEYVQAHKNVVNARRLENKAHEKHIKKNRDREQYGYNTSNTKYDLNALNKAKEGTEKAEETEDKILDRQYKLYDTKAGKKRTVLPNYKTMKDYTTQQVGYKKNGEPFNT